MQEIKTMEQFDEICDRAKDLVVLELYGLGFATDNVATLLEQLEEKYSGAISFYKVCAQVLLPVFSKFSVCSVPTVLMMSKGKYDGTEMRVHAKLHGVDITAENLMALISEYRNEVPLK